MIGAPGSLTRDEAASATADEDGSIWLDLVGGDFEVRYAAEPPPADSCKKVETPTWIVPIDPGTSGTGVITPGSNIGPMNPMACEMAENAPVSASGTSPDGSSSAIQPYAPLHPAGHAHVLGGGVVEVEEPPRGGEAHQRVGDAVVHHPVPPPPDLRRR